MSLAVLGNLPGAGPWDILENSSPWDWTVPFLLDWESTFLRDGEPVTVFGYNPETGWGSYDSVTFLSPLESSVWGGAGWEYDFSSSSIPESAYVSGVGLIENTDARNRYSAYLRRPVPESILMDISLSRDDTLNHQRLFLGRGDLAAGGRGWQTAEDGYVLWTGWNPRRLRTRLTFGHMYRGNRYWELMSSYGFQIEELSVQAAAAGSLNDDSVFSVHCRGRLEYPLLGTRAVAKGILYREDGEVSLGGTAGIIGSSGIFSFQAGLAKQPGENARMVGLVGLLDLHLMVEADENEVQGGAQVALANDYGLFFSGAGLTQDSLFCSGTLLPSLPWGHAGRIHGGVSWEAWATDSTSGGTLDLKSMFTLGRFAFIFAVEDIVDSWRSYSFGVTWSFRDEPPAPEEREDRGR
ncbi:MAG: hypothetical protein GF388_03245 [Candidatus Aegiribacteria sp.]|nr:hypothetical protein [Candidatus Aegiribacteria sp.]MBD3294284.1 hypothetical protein [Candidatus Fermentibacteria bacterium]